MSANKPKKKLKLSWTLWGIVLVVLVAVIGGIGWMAWSYFNGKGSDLAAAEEKSKEFIGYLEEQDFSELANTATESTLVDAGYTREQLTELYQTTFDEMQISNVEVTNFLFNENETDDRYEFSYQLNLTSPIGTVEELAYSSFLTKDADGEFTVDWNPNLILPGMEPGDTVDAQFSKGERGNILDRDGDPLAIAGTWLQAGLHPSLLGEGEVRTENLNQISETFDVPLEYLEELLGQSWVTGDSFVPFKVMANEDSVQATGVVYQELTMRTYPLNEAAAHLIGYVGEVSAEDIEKNPALAVGDTIGKSGLEAAFDEQLRGKLGGKIVLNDVQGNTKEVLKETEISNGEDVQLTIDADVQQKAYEELEGVNGSVVVMNPEDGSLIALVSTPSYDAGLMTRGITNEAYQAYLDDENSPFLARYTARLAPGSTFKMITAGIGLDSGTTTAEEIHEIGGDSWQANASWGNYSVHRVTEVPEVTLKDALVYSDNIFFAQEALEMGQETFEQGTEKFIFGESLNLPFSMEPAQLSNSGTLDSEILLADTAYGQGELLMSPVQQAVSFSPFVNGGNLVYPKLTNDQETNETKQVVSAESAELIRSYLLEVVANQNGTAHQLADLPYTIGAKTGTAEFQGLEENEDNGFVMAFDAEENSYVMIGLVEGRTSGEVITILKPLLQEMPALLQ
ncbi:penicillin-binding transpeptidase domain-containing protein [Desemzia sp. RIT804]|uniref:penicillin-binding protein PBP4(5) n=1 Tax=Desemzia sp. RIT 804 TaxID=2810209 RepID=UPI00194F2CC2|nr:penicillin-binding transpeptidase domain-containing protein [Desemzia sp. RIT 804]MBM6614380.1 penicillin-binding transpeptidase domain-containing protein [Desemzia sp. RIT 804]